MRRLAVTLISSALAVLCARPADLFAEQDQRPELRDHPKERAEWNAMFRRDRDGRVLSENRLKALRQACEIPVDPSMAKAPAGAFFRSDSGPSIPASATFSGTTWQSVGPLPMQSFTGNPNRQYGNVGGRVDSIAVHPTNPSILLLGSATGGIWKSTDAGQTWRPVSDYAPALAISHIAFSPANPSIVYAATGESDEGFLEFDPSQSLGTYLGAGLLKSLDAGDTWFRVDTTFPPNSILSRVIPHPTNVNLVVVGMRLYQDVGADKGYVGGAYLSTDGGVSFSRKLLHQVTDVVQDPNTPDRLYLATGNCTSCGPSGVYLSIDFGTSWSPNWTVASGVGIGDTKLGISKTSPTTLYASFLESDDTHKGIYVSADAGLSWTTKTFDPSMCPTSTAKLGANQCNYDHFISPDPFHPATVYFGSISLYKSLDSGGTWVKQVDVYPAAGVATLHPDQHAGVFDLSGALLIGNDGGVYRSHDGASSFENLNATLNASQFQRIALHPTNPDFAMGGTQDNGGQRYTGSLTWSDRIAGDGGFMLIRTNSPAEILAAHYLAYFAHSLDGGTTFTAATDCTHLMNCTNDKGLETMAFYPPAIAMPSAPETVLFGTNRIWYNQYFGADSTQWQPLMDAPITSATGDYLTAVEATSDLNGTVWAGSRQGYVYDSPAGDPNFYHVGGGVLPLAPVTKIITISADGSNAYVTFGGYLGSPSNHVFRTSNGGTTWTNISSNLPDVPVLTMAVDPGDPTDLVVGTDVGVFRSRNGGATWNSFNVGLPNVPVYDLKFHPITNDLWAATYGRGVWRISGSCVPDAFTACLIGGRYKVTSHWQNQYAGGQISTLSASTLTDATAAFWVSDPSSYEYLIRISTATPNGHAWIAIPTFTDVEFWIEMTDTTSGQYYEYHSSAGNRTLIYDPYFFDYPLRTGDPGSEMRRISVSDENLKAGLVSAGCTEDASTMCLAGGRYKVTSTWKNQYAGGAVSTLNKAKLTDATGAFWLLDSNSYEYLIRISTATPNGRAWIAIPTFTDVEFWITVQDMVNSQVNTYHSAPGNRTLIYDPYFFVYP
ncbi:MAG: hypothetical protein ACHQPI_03480 [Thermoanaerobaculia bacterium]